MEKSSDLINQLEGKYSDFYKFHGIQLIAINFPPIASLIKKLYDKLMNELYDASKFFSILENYDDEKYE